MNRVYLSGMFSQKELIKQRSLELVEQGIEVTSSWVHETADPKVQSSDLPNHYLRHTAIIDIRDMLNANTLVLFIPSDTELETVPRRSLSRGGRNFEQGFFYALVMFDNYLPLRISTKREVCLVGPRESVFHWLYDMAEGFDHVAGIKLPTIKQFDTWEQCKSYLNGDCVYESGECSKISRTKEEAEQSAHTEG